LPTRAATPPTGERWVHEVKHDGFRIVARRVAGVVRLYSKQGYDWSSRYPLIVEALSSLRVQSVVLDGEAMCFTRDGMHDFDALWDRTNDNRAKLCAFDLLELNGEDFRAKPLLERKARLAKLLRKDREGIEYVEHLQGDGARIFAHVCKLGLEGIVSKRIDMRYQPGPSKSWIKVKNTKHPALLHVKEAFVLERQHGRRNDTWPPSAARLSAQPGP
jgi:ATP-dependent DNA ligase